MINFVFWNVKGQADISVIANLAIQVDANFIILAECDKQPSDILEALNAEDENLYFFSPNINCEKIMIFSTFKSTLLNNSGDNDRLTSRRLKHPLHGDVLIVACHLISKINASEIMQNNQTIMVNQFIESIERQENLNRTLVIGDMNMSPFDPGMVAAEGLHALPHLSVVKREKRRIQGESYNMFYNPMWYHLSRDALNPSGTYYRSSSDSLNYYWYVLDQVILRPSLIPLFRQDLLQIITKVGGTNLLTPRGVPDKLRFSDHLPITCSLGGIESDESLA